MPWMLMATGLLEGAALLTLLTVLWEPGTVVGATLGFGIVFASVNATLWHRYRTTARGQGIKPLARAVLEAVTPWLHGVGHAAPLVFFILAFVSERNAGAWALLAAACALAGGALWKIAVITRACYQQGFRLDRLPRRGSGTYAASARI